MRGGFFLFLSGNGRKINALAKRFFSFMIERERGDGEIVYQGVRSRLEARTMEMIVVK